MISKEIKCNLGLSNIHGIGVFAIRDIKKGEHLFPVSERTIEIKDLDEKAMKVVLNRNVIYTTFSTVEHPNLEVNYTAFMNHSDNPNSDGSFALVSIKEGEEITESYRHENMSDISEKHFTFL